MSHCYRIYRIPHPVFKGPPAHDFPIERIISRPRGMYRSGIPRGTYVREEDGWLHIGCFFFILLRLTESQSAGECRYFNLREATRRHMDTNVAHLNIFRISVRGPLFEKDDASPTKYAMGGNMNLSRRLADSESHFKTSRSAGAPRRPRRGGGGPSDGKCLQKMPTMDP